MSDSIERNRASIERLRAVERYVTQMRSLERILEEFRFNLSKTKLIVGFTLAETGLVNTHELNPSKRISVEADDDEKLVFQLDESVVAVSSAGADDGLRQRNVHKDKNGDNNDEDVGEGESSIPAPLPTVFRPFGVFEPNNAKLARRNIASALSLVCELASLRQKIRQLDTLNANLAKRMHELSVKD